jgi:hypothetical protein
VGFTFFHVGAMNPVRPMKKHTLLTDIVERIAKRDTCLYITNKHDFPLTDFANHKVDSRKFIVHLETFADDN